jgi:hypothetical protein
MKEAVMKWFFLSFWARIKQILTGKKNKTIPVVTLEDKKFSEEATSISDNLETADREYKFRKSIKSIMDDLEHSPEYRRRD